MHQPVQPKSLSWWGKVGNSLILQHSLSRAGSLRPHTWILEWAVIILINAPARTRTRDLWLWYHIELHAPTSSTRKLKLMGKGEQFTYTPTLPSLMLLFCFFIVVNSLLVFFIGYIGIWEVKILSSYFYLYLAFCKNFIVSCWQQSSQVKEKKCILFLHMEYGHRWISISWFIYGLKFNTSAFKWNVLLQKFI
jgi:hypothetical protein